MIDQTRRTQIFCLCIRIKSLGQDYHTLPVDIMGFKEFTQDNLGFTIGIYIGRVECLLVSCLIEFGR
jgi:hypothetical protein